MGLQTVSETSVNFHQTERRCNPDEIRLHMNMFMCEMLMLTSHFINLQVIPIILSVCRLWVVTAPSENLREGPNCGQDVICDIGCHLNILLEK
jgi:hypothetical protein